MPTATVYSALCVNWANFARFNTWDKHGETMSKCFKSGETVRRNTEIEVPGLLLLQFPTSLGSRDR